MLVRAPAKINLTLEVLDRRSDGYHGIRTLMVPLALGDELDVSTRSGPLDFSCDDPALDGEENLALRALRALGASGVHVRLRKEIPTQAGLGGGSSDAGSVLLAAIDGAFGPQPERDWVALARSLGSDVPFFLAGTAALVEGTGERVTAAGALPPWHVVIVKPPGGVSTAEAYARLDAQSRPSRPRSDSVSLRALEALQRGDFAGVTERLHNDFDAAIGTEPAIARAFDALRAAGAKRPLLAGSGSAVFALVETADERSAIARAVALPDDYRVFTTAFVTDGSWV